MSRRFRHFDEDWEAEATGMGHGVGSVSRPPITSWGVAFRCISNPAKGPYYGRMATPDVGHLTEEELRKSLEDAITKVNKSLVLRALEDPEWDWRTVQGVVRDTGLTEELITAILEASPDEVIRSRVPDARGRALYTTRRHYTSRRGFLDRFRTA